MKNLKVSILGLILMGTAHAEDSFARKTNGLSGYKAAFAKFEQVRRNLLDPQEGGIVGLQETNQKLRDWIFKYRQLTNQALDSLAQGGPYEVFLGKLEDLVNQNNQELALITVEFLAKEATISSSVSAIPRDTLNYQIPGFVDQQKRFDTLKVAILDAISQGLASNQKVYIDLGLVQNDLKDLYKKKARQIFIQRNIDQVEAKITEIDKVLSRSLLAGPYIQSVQVANSTYTEAYLTLDYFGMKKKIGDLKQACDSYSNFVVKNPELNKRSQKEQAVVKNLCDSTQTDFERLVNEKYQGNIRQIIADAVVYYRKPAVEDYCKNHNAGKYNCNVYSWAGNLAAEDILQFTDKQLADYEDLWATILRKKG